MRLAQDTGATVPTDKGANAGLKDTAMVAGMIACADSIDDTALLRHGGIKKVFHGCYALSTLGSFRRSFTFRHVKQLDTVASLFLINLAGKVSLFGDASEKDFVYVDVDVGDTIIEVHGYQKQGSGFGYSGIRGLNAVLNTASRENTAPVISPGG